MPCGKYLTSGTFIRADPISTKLILTKLKFHIYYFFDLFPFKILKRISEIDYTIPAPVTEGQLCSEMPAGDPGLCEFVDQEESSIMESPKRESSEWTDEKHSLYLKSMEASFVDQLYNSLDPRSWKTQKECSSDSMSSRRIHVSTRCPSGQFKVLQHGFWSRFDFKRENSVRNEANIPHTSSNPWIQHFRNGNRRAAPDSISPDEKASLTQNSLQFPESNLQLHCQQTNCSNAEVTDQNFVQEDYVVQKVNTPCSKKRKGTSAASGSGNGQPASVWHFSCDRNS